jgi:hypothetical protein
MFHGGKKGGLPHSITRGCNQTAESLGGMISSHKPDTPISAVGCMSDAVAHHRAGAHRIGVLWGPGSVLV